MVAPPLVTALVAAVVAALATYVSVVAAAAYASFIYPSSSLAAIHRACILSINYRAFLTGLKVAIEQIYPTLPDVLIVKQA